MSLGLVGFLIWLPILSPGLLSLAAALQWSPPPSPGRVWLRLWPLLAGSLMRGPGCPRGNVDALRLLDLQSWFSCPLG